MSSVPVLVYHYGTIDRTGISVNMFGIPRIVFFRNTPFLSLYMLDLNVLTR